MVYNSFMSLDSEVMPLVQQDPLREPIYDEEVVPQRLCHCLCRLVLCADRLCKPGEVIHDDEDVLLFFFDFDVEKIDGNEF